MYGAQCAWGAAQPQRTCALHGAAQYAQRIYGAQCMGRSSAAAHMHTAHRGAAQGPADKMRAADGTACARPASLASSQASQPAISSPELSQKGKKKTVDFT